MSGEFTRQTIVVAQTALNPNQHTDHLALFREDGTPFTGGEGGGGSEELEARVVVLEGQVVALDSEVTALQGQVTTLEGQVTTLEGANTTLQGQVTALETANTDLVAQLAALDARVAALETPV